jgi:CDGSH-type Zn-finger protein
MMADDVSVTPTDSGPYQIRGRIRLVLPSGREIETEEDTWLCRCGGSQHKPFCDGTHAKIGFNAVEAGVDEAETSDGDKAVADEGDAKPG